MGVLAKDNLLMDCLDGESNSNEVSYHGKLNVT